MAPAATARSARRLTLCGISSLESYRSSRAAPNVQPEVSSAMASCDVLLTNATVVTMDEQFSVHAPGAIAIAGDSIVAVGPEARDYAAPETIDCGARAVLP